MKNTQIKSSSPDYIDENKFGFKGYTKGHYTTIRQTLWKLKAHSTFSQRKPFF